MVRQAPVICVMAPPIHLGAWSMALITLHKHQMKATTNSQAYTVGVCRLPHFRELVEGEENKRTTFSTWTIMFGVANPIYV